MAIEIDGTGTPGLFLTSNVPSRDPCTVMAWFYFNNAGAASETLFFLGNNSYSETISVYVDASAVLSVFNGSSGGTGSTLSSDTWYHVALRRSGASMQIYLDGVQDITNSANNPTVTAEVDWGNSSLYDTTPMDARSAAFKYYEAQLTAGEIQNGMQFFTPTRTANLAMWLPSVADDVVNFRDYSGNARDMSEAGTVTAGAGPPITWRKGASRIFVPAGAAPPVTGRAKFLPLLGVA